LSPPVLPQQPPYPKYLHPLVILLYPPPHGAWFVLERSRMHNQRSCGPLLPCWYINLIISLKLNPPPLRKRLSDSPFYFICKGIINRIQPIKTMAMDCSSRVSPGGLSPPLGPVPTLPSIYSINYKLNSITLSHHCSSFHICSVDLPFPSPTHGRRWRCAAFCGVTGVHPSHTQLGSSVFPISQSH